MVVLFYAFRVEESKSGVSEVEGGSCLRESEECVPEWLVMAADGKGDEEYGWVGNGMALHPLTGIVGEDSGRDEDELPRGGTERRKVSGADDAEVDGGTCSVQIVGGDGAALPYDDDGRRAEMVDDAEEELVLSALTATLMRMTAAEVVVGVVAKRLEQDITHQAVGPGRLNAKTISMKKTEHDVICDF